MTMNKLLLLEIESHFAEQLDSLNWFIFRAHKRHEMVNTVSSLL
jgi:hypothetical protein